MTELAAETLYMSGTDERGARLASEPMDDTAIATLYAEEYDGLYRLGVLLTSNAAVASELVQDAFVGLLRRGRSTDNPAAYLRTAVVNGARSYHRRRGVADKHAPKLRASVTHERLPEFDETFRVLDRLPPRQRMAVVLRYYEDLPEAEIARRLRCRPGTVKSTLHRALAALREELSA